MATATKPGSVGREVARKVRQADGATWSEKIAEESIRKRIAEEERIAMRKNGSRLTRSPAASRMGGSTQGAARVGRRRSELDTATYSGRIAQRLRDLRTERGWSVEKLQERLKKAGTAVPASSVYAYENGVLGGGADLPTNLYPTYAKAFGFKTVPELLPPH